MNSNFFNEVTRLFSREQGKNILGRTGPEFVQDHILLKGDNQENAIMILKIFTTTGLVRDES